MAGGAKESPRQKMIGMMYLVLTALLALQVSNTVLQKFIFIDLSLRQSVNATLGQNGARLQAIQDQVEKKGNKARDKKVLENAKKARELTNEMMNFIEEMRENIITKTGGITDDGQLAGAKDYDKQMNYTLGPEGKKNGAAYVLEGKLNKYVEDINTLHDSLSFSSIALPASQIDIFKNDKDQKNKDFAELNFDHTPTVACMAILSQFKTQVANVEAKALEELAKDVGAEELRFDKIIPVVSPNSRVVAAGTKYTAEMFIAASSSTTKPSMKYNGKPVKVEDGKGIIEFVANASSYDKENQSKQTWKGEITFTTPFGDTTLKIEEEFIVAKPVVQVQSGSVSALYLNCGNVLQINVPALGTDYNPSFTASGADVVKGSKKGMVTVIPKQGKVGLNVFSNGNKLSTENFSVKKVPKPTITITSRGKKVDLKNGLSVSQFPRSLEANAVAEPSFAEFLPKDARYRVTGWEITLARGKRALGSKKESSPKVNLTDLASKARPGDRIVIEIKKVQRKNFRDQMEGVAGVSEIFTIPLN
ncbi:gliding motility protein GldM [Flexithrix dorotheae]|uniref:type IX secretion system motor protein PorM/GldM n=1 Tax=Flexithrix dorotheae TaxID=70993 RepID=UPI00037B33FF|nr:gliding motility protein GldM [Flexithrix dorotheae]